jgi:hypothetical protein
MGHRECWVSRRGQNRDTLRIEMADFPFSPSSTCKKKGPPLLWHLRTEEQAEIDNAWNSIRTGEQTQEVLACLGLRKSRQEFITANQNSLLSTRIDRLFRRAHSGSAKFFSVSSNIAWLGPPADVACWFLATPAACCVHWQGSG